MAEKGTLNVRQQRFVEEYLVDLNGTQAAIRAGYRAKTAKVHASRLLSHANVHAAIEAARAKLSKRIGVTQEMVLNELRRIGFSDTRKVFTDGGDLRRPTDWDDDTAAAISSIEVVERNKPGGRPGEVERVTKVRHWDKVAGLEKLGKHLGMFIDRAEVELKDSRTVDQAREDMAQKLDRIAGRLPK